MLSLKVPPPPPWPHIFQATKGQENTTLTVDNESSQDEPANQPQPNETTITSPQELQPVDIGEVEEEPTPPVNNTTEQTLSKTLNSIRIPMIEHDWKKCISEIEKVINLQPSHEEYNNPVTLRNIEQYKDRLGKNLYDCKINQQKKEDEDKLLLKKKRQKAQEELERGLELKYNLKPQQSQPQSQSYSQPQSQSQPQSYGETSWKEQPYSQLPSQQDYPQEISSQGEAETEGEPQKEGVTEKKEGDRGVLSKVKSFFTGDEIPEGQGEEEKDDMVDTINSYLKSSYDPSLPETVHLDDIKGIDNLIDNYKELVENYDLLDERFQKYKESQRVKNFKNTSLINDKKETIDNLTSIVVKLEKALNDYKKTSEKKYVSQSKVHEKELEKLKKENDNENREVHKYMQGLLNERIDNANLAIKDIIDETELSEEDKVKSLQKVKTKTKTKSRKKKNKPKKRSVQKKKKSKKKSKGDRSLKKKKGA